MLIQGNARQIPLADASVHMVCTSPPYWGLRHYGHYEMCTLWGTLAHFPRPRKHPERHGLRLRWRAMARGGVWCPQGCCWIGALGGEPTPALYVQHLVQVFREVWRVLRPDGTVWLNLGDSYTSGGRQGHGTRVGSQQQTNRGMHGTCDPVRAPQPAGLKPKDLCGIPWRVVFALQDDGWTLRHDGIEQVELSCPCGCGYVLEERIWRQSQDREIIWAKPNPMPESVTDRPTKSHEYLFLLTKQVRYFYDAVAIAEPHTMRPQARPNGHTRRRPGPLMAEHTWSGTIRHTAGVDGPLSGRNKRSVWTIPTSPYPGAHFACVDDQTECLTSTGWKRWDALVPGESIAQWNPFSQQASWGFLKGIATYDVQNIEMVQIKTTQQDQLLTRNHRCFVFHGTRATEPKVVLAEALTAEHRMPTATTWEEGLEPIFISAAWAELLGWYVAEGHQTSHVRVEVYQSEYHNPHFCQRIETLLQEVEADYEKVSASRSYRGTSREEAIFLIRGFAAAKLQLFAPGKAKKLSWEVLQWSPIAQQALLAGLLGGDGHHRPDGRTSFIQKSQGIADLVQGLGIRLGLGAVQSLRPDGMRSVYFTQNHRTRSLRGTNGNGAVLQRVTYSGIVWCPETPLGTWIARRNGKVCITGNTFPEALVEPCVLAGTSARGCCAQCGAPWRRTVNKVQHGKQDYHGKYLAQEQAGAGRNMLASARAARAAGWPHDTPFPGPQTTGWAPTCSHDAPLVPCVVFDPFCGRGTTVKVAERHGRIGIGMDLSLPYLRQAQGWLGHRVPLAAEDPVQRSLFGMDTSQRSTCAQM